MSKPSERLVWKAGDITKLKKSDSATKAAQIASRLTLTNSFQRADAEEGEQQS